ncbi:uncharacterized protein LOC112198734 [Rosa chinensis]|uniref:uncharacterized protein LOC112198734 n=1 Tax=Rosa chinensis TaxID=74649 RepID=UPI000D087DA6|nr:uncharacterized protein LOC112198734 [Rosa chinensis]
MDIISWNCRGICNDATVRVLKDLITHNRPQIVFLCETKIKVLSDGQSGGLALFWCAEVDSQDSQPLTKSAHHIDAEVRGGPGEPRWRLFGFYGYARTAEHDKSWQLLKYLSDLDFLPWVVIGDFNEILNNGEKIDGPPKAERHMRGFREVLGYCELLDLGFQGSRETWWNSETHLRLDRAVCTPSWCDVFGYAKVIHLPHRKSDHVPILLHEKWQADFSGAPMFQVTKKITNTRMALDKWQRETFRVRQQQMMGVRTRLEEFMDATVTVTIQEEKKTLMDKLHVLLSEEKAFWRQRAKIQWLKEGDSNTGFFHRKAANRKRKNVIHGLYDENGVWRDDDKGMEQIVTSYFTQMFTSSPIDMEAMHHTLEAIQPCVSAEMNLQLCRNYTEEEIREALFQMYPTKSPGPDGMAPLFFQHYWDTIGKDVTEAVQNFLHTGNLLKQVNFTHICLISKVSNLERMADLRPIALCNVIYKICSKAIANRLKIILPSIISPFQSAFVPGHLITDNLVVNEVAHFVHSKREGPEGVMALKLDLSKAYDRMERFFLRKVMERFGFALVWIELVMQCVCSVRFSFLIRGKPRGYVSPSRGLRQGDPLSPYLFLIGAEGFSALLQKKQELGLLPGIEASLEACYEIQDVIETYGRASGQLAWRIISAPASLIAGVYKAKYFPEGSFWSATAHTAPSYSWRSIFATRELLKLGSYWQIGSGTKVNVWSDAWVPGLPNFVPHVTQIQVNDNLNVNELMRAQGVWHEERVRALFNGVEAKAILAIPLSTRPVDDRLFWKLESIGNFMVKTAYRFAYSNSIERANVLGNVTSCFWKKIWHAKIPNTAKVTIWKICQNILPTKDRLTSKQVQIESQSCVLLRELESLPSRLTE